MVDFEILIRISITEKLSFRFGNFIQVGNFLKIKKSPCLKRGLLIVSSPELFKYLGFSVLLLFDFLTEVFSG